MPRETLPPESSRGLYVLSLSVHGLFRGSEIELGRDADTGGQVLYVLDQARTLGRQPEVHLVEILTRQIFDRRVHKDYSAPREELEEGTRIVRLPFGPRRYLYKERLWPYLPSLTDQVMRLVRARGRAPDLIHGHYADAGFVGAQVAKILGIPFLFTGHSLGRVKRARLLEQEQDQDLLEDRYNFVRRIEAEEGALETASLVIASTRQEVRDQYELYDHYQPDRMVVIPPGVDLSRFSPPGEAEDWQGIGQEVDRFLEDPGKPLIMAMARADERKNFAALVHAFGTNTALRHRANLLLVMGSRQDINTLPAGAKRVLTDILILIDRYDLYGSVAYPKELAPDDTPRLYRKAAASGGVFVNPALTEPFGLTLLEAAASGLPIVATNDGGPRDIVDACRNGFLIDPSDPEAMGRRILEVLEDRGRWRSWSEKGLEGVHRHFSWESHARRYLDAVEGAVGGWLREEKPRPLARRHRLPRLDRLLVTDVDDTLTGDAQALEALGEALENAGETVGWALATGRSLPRTLEILEELSLPQPDILITATGTEIQYGSPPVKDRSWEQQIAYNWEPGRVRGSLSALDGLSDADPSCETRYRIRFRLTSPGSRGVQHIRRHLRRDGLHVTVTLDHETDLDITPIRASPGLAIRFIAHKWNLAPRRILVAGDSGNDAAMLSGETLGVVVGNHSPELDDLAGHPRIHFAQGHHAWGVLEGIRHYDFFGSIRIPDEDDT